MFDILFEGVHAGILITPILNVDNKAIDSKWIHVDIQKSLDTLYEGNP